MKTIKEIEFVNYDGEKKSYEMFVDARSLMTFEKIYRLETGNKKSTFINSLENLADGDITLIMCLIGSTVRKEGKKQPVGLDYAMENIPPLENLETFSLALQQCLEDLKVEKDKNDMGK